MSQLSLGLDNDPPPPPVSPERRLDVTLQRVADLHEAMTDEERAEIDERLWGMVVIVSRVRAMERAEEEVLERPAPNSLADTYDRIVQPGEHVIKALLRVFAVQYGTGA